MKRQPRNPKGTNKPTQKGIIPRKCGRETLSAIRAMTDEELSQCPYPTGSGAKIEVMRERLARAKVAKRGEASDNVLMTADDYRGTIPPKKHKGSGINDVRLMRTKSHTSEPR